MTFAPLGLDYQTMCLRCLQIRRSLPLERVLYRGGPDALARPRPFPDQSVASPDQAFRRSPSIPRATKFSAISNPINPPPTTTALRGFRVSIQWRISLLSGIERRVKMPAKLTSGSGGFTGVAPGIGPTHLGHAIDRACAQIAYLDLLGAPCSSPSPHGECEP